MKIFSLVSALVCGGVFREVVTSAFACCWSVARQKVITLGVARCGVTCCEATLSTFAHCNVFAQHIVPRPCLYSSHPPALK